MWTYCERIAVQNIKRYEIERETQIVGIWIFVVTPVLYATGSNKAKVIFMKMFVNVISGLKCNMDRW